MPKDNFRWRDDYLQGGYHGHMVDTYLYMIANYFVRLGITVTVNGTPYGPPVLPPPAPPAPPPPVEPPPKKAF